MKEKRIEILDSFRFLAIISVIFYHYTYRWTIPASYKNLYPYGTYYGNIFEYGRMGVQFFFIISGFVISYTLENTSGLSTFFKNRFIRLFPPILLWSVITYSVFIIFDTNLILPDSHFLKNFLPSLTFIKPEIWSLILNHSFSWLNGSYWSLWVEVQFYIIASLLFFMNREKFFRNLLLVTIIISLANYLVNHFSQKNSNTHFFLLASQVNELFNISYYICYFSLGAIFHYLYKRSAIRLTAFTSLCMAVIFLYQFYACVTFQARILYIIMIALFVLMIYKRQYLFFLENPLFRRIGVISYSVYLAHENIGILLINKFGGYLGKWSPISLFIVLILIILLAELSYRFIEQKTARILKRLLFKPKKTAPSIIPDAGFY
jgi:peptidoglycan/LPS O-acetylase OafA/YrhL